MSDIAPGCPVFHDGAAPDDNRLPVGEAPADSEPEGALPHPTRGSANKGWGTRQRRHAPKERPRKQQLQHLRQTQRQPHTLTPTVTHIYAELKRFIHSD